MSIILHPHPSSPIPSSPVASCHVIYGERIGLFSSSPSLESQKFIWAVEQMLVTTPPLLYLPHRLLLRIGAPLWTQHATAWDHIFSHGRKSYELLLDSLCTNNGPSGLHFEFIYLSNQYISPSLLPSYLTLSYCLVHLQADARIQKWYQRLSSSQGWGSEAGAPGGQYNGVLGQLMEKGQLSLDLIKANITELMAGGVDTVCTSVGVCLHFCVCTWVCVCERMSPTSVYHNLSRCDFSCILSADSGAPAVCSVWVRP